MLISSNQLASTGCGWPIGLIVFGVLIIFGSITLYFDEYADWSNHCGGCLGGFVGLLLIAWVLWGDTSTGFCDLN